MPEKWDKPCRIHAVRCPHCGERNDCMTIDYAIESMLADPKQQLDVGCDHCGQNFRIVKAERPLLVWVKPIEAEEVRGFDNVPTPEEQAAFEASDEYKEWIKKPGES